MKHTVCIPYIKASLQEIRTAIPPDLSAEDVIEIYVDALKDGEHAALRSFPDTVIPKCVYTFRRPGFALQARDLEFRKKLLDTLVGTAALCDFDINREREEIGHLKATGSSINLLASYHNYEATPGIADLRAVYASMKQEDPRCFKFASLCMTDADVLSLLEILVEIRREGKCALVGGMGEKGRVVRITGALWGNQWTYTARTPEEATAPGQLTYLQFREIMNLLVSPDAA